MVNVYVNFITHEGRYDSVIVPAASLDPVDVFNAIIPEIRPRRIDTITEFFEDKD